MMNRLCFFARSSILILALAQKCGNGLQLIPVQRGLTLNLQLELSTLKLDLNLI